MAGPVVEGPIFVGSVIGTSVVVGPVVGGSFFVGSIIGASIVVDSVVDGSFFSLFCFSLAALRIFFAVCRSPRIQRPAACFASSGLTPLLISPFSTRSFWVSINFFAVSSFPSAQSLPACSALAGVTPLLISRSVIFCPWETRSASELFFCEFWVHRSTIAPGAFIILSIVWPFSPV